MAAISVDTRSVIMVALVLAALVGGGYLLNPSYMNKMLGLKEGFEGATNTPTLPANSNYKANAPSMNVAGQAQMAAITGGANENSTAQLPVNANEGYADLSQMEGPSGFGNAEAPAGCYPRDQLTPSELLPKDPNSVWAQQNPMGTGSLKGKNFLSAGALIGVNTVGQSLRNANYQLRSEPPNPQQSVSIFNQTTIEPDVNRRTMEIA